MEASADFNIVDHYYYPDSDLETIQEESSVLDSEDDGSIRSSSRRSSSSTITSSKLDKEVSRGNKSSSFFYENNKKGSNTKHDHSNPITSSTYVSYNGFNDPSSDIKGSTEALSNQKIIYAKCLTGNNNSKQHFNPTQAQNGVIDQSKSATITDMFEAARIGKLSLLRTFTAGELSNTVDESGNTPLHVAAERGHLGCIKLLVSHFSSDMVSLPNDDLMTAAALSVKQNHLECVQWLLRHSSARDELTVSQRASSIDGSSTRPPLAHVAARFDRCEILDWLCGEMSRDNIAIDVGDHSSNTPVHVAAHYGHLRSIQILVARGASVTALNSDGNTPGQAARRLGHDTTVGYLVVVETCVSLAQQLVALRNEVEGLKTENVRLKKEAVQPFQSIQTPASNDASKNNPTSINGKKEEDQTLSKDYVKDLSNKRRTLQEQPPPPKLWDSSEKQEKKISVNTVASIKGHKAVTNISSKKVKSQSPLQQKIDEALNGPGTMVDDDDINMLRVSDVDLPGTSVDGTTSETEPFDYKDINSEVETITKEIDPKTEKKPWEKLTMDEMLRRVRDIRYQPSPSISLCTEDSTMESVETMRERMAAASRWFLVEKGMEKPKPATAVSHRHMPKIMEKSHNQPASLSSHGNAAGKRRIVNQPLLPSVASQSATKMQNAIHEHYQLNENREKEKPKVRDKIFPKPMQSVTSPETEPSKPVPTSAVPSGTLKFMVSHSKKTMKKSNPTQDFNPPSQITSSKHQEQEVFTESSPTSPVASVPVLNSTQRNNSYRRAVQVSGAEKSASLSENHSKAQNCSGAGGSSPQQVHIPDERSTVARKTSSRKEFVKSDLPTKQKSDPLHKRTGKEPVPGPVWTQPQSSGSLFRPVSAAINSKYTKPVITKHESKEKPVVSTPRYNQWTIPKSERVPAPVSLHSRFDDDENDGFEVSEVPELKAEIPSRQSSFLRRVQGKLR